MDSISEYSGGFGGSESDFLHQLWIVLFRARLGITLEKSGSEPSWSLGVKPKPLQTCTVNRSKVWPEETTTGSDIKELKIGQRNSVGGEFLVSDLEDLCIEIFHRLNFPFPPIL